MSLTSLFVVTLNWNLADETIASVQSVLAAGISRERTIIVDNGSSDRSTEAFAETFGPTLPLIRNKENLGFGGGMNKGIERALEQGATSVLILNNDTTIDQAMPATLMRASESLNSPGILGPAIYYFDHPDRIWKLGDIRYRSLPMPLSVRLHTRDMVTAPPFQVDYVTGCGMLVRREVFEQVGLFDARYFMYFEDADFCRRARDAGFAAWCVPQAKMWHKISATAQRDKPLSRYHRALGQVRFYHEHMHGPSALLSEGYIAAKLVKTVVSDLWRRDWNLISPLWRGTVDGYREQARVTRSRQHDRQHHRDRQIRASPNEEN